MILRLAIVTAALALAACASMVAEDEAPGTSAETEKPAAPPPRPSPPPKVAIAPPTTITPKPETAPVAAPQSSRVTDIDSLLSDFGRLRRLSAPEIAREQDAARSVFNATRSDASRLRFAMTMAVPGTAANDENQALTLLDPLVRNPTAPLHGLAFLLAAYIQEQRRLAVQVQGLQKNEAGLQQNVQALEKKLDALRTLERSLSEREAGGRRR